MCIYLFNFTCDLMCRLKTVIFLNGHLEYVDRTVSEAEEKLSQVDVELLQKENDVEKVVEQKTYVQVTCCIFIIIRSGLSPGPLLTRLLHASLFNMPSNSYSVFWVNFIIFNQNQTVNVELYFFENRVFTFFITFWFTLGAEELLFMNHITIMGLIQQHSSTSFPFFFANHNNRKKT